MVGVVIGMILIVRLFGDIKDKHKDEIVIWE